VGTGRSVHRLADGGADARAKTVEEHDQIIPRAGATGRKLCMTAMEQHRASTPPACRPSNSIMRWTPRARYL